MATDYMATFVRANIAIDSKRPPVRAIQTEVRAIQTDCWIDMWIVT